MLFSWIKEVIVLRPEAEFIFCVKFYNAKHKDGANHLSGKEVPGEDHMAGLKPTFCVVQQHLYL
jgi:hypothetical protein